MSDDKKTTIGAACAAWWRRTIPEGRAPRARLRRVGAPIDALMIAETHALAAEIEKAGHDMRSRPDTLAAIALALGHVEESSDANVARNFGTEPGADRPRISETRFQVIVRAQSPFEAAQRIARQLPIINRKANVPSLASDLFWWGDSVRARWTLDYYS